MKSMGLGALVIAAALAGCSAEIEKTNQASGADGGSNVTAGDGGTGAQPDGASAAPASAPTIDPPVAIDVGNHPLTFAANHTTNRLYVSLRTPTGGGGGIAVIDTTTNTVITTIAAPMLKGSAQLISTLAVDEVSNKVYAGPLFATGAGYPIWVVDGATNTLEAEAIAAPETPLALAVDPGKRLFALTFPNGSGPQNVAVFDVSGATPSSIATVPIDDLAVGDGRLAFDTENHLLFVCGSLHDSSQGAAVDTIDTTTNTVKGAQTTFDPQKVGYFVDCKGGAGWSTMVTNGTTSDPAVLHELEPADIRLGDGPGFIPTAYASGAGPGSLADRRHVIVVLGHDSATGRQAFYTVKLHGEHVDYLSGVADFPSLGKDDEDLVWSTVNALSNDSSYALYASASMLTDNSIYFLHIR
jgi:hypothetical protein